MAKRARVFGGGCGRYAQPRSGGYYRNVCRIFGSRLLGIIDCNHWNFSTFIPAHPFVAPILIRNRNNVYVQGFVKGAYGAVIGTILGACVLLSKIAIGDRLTALIALGSLVVLFKWKVSNPLLVAITAAIGLIAFPLLQPPWVLLK